MFTLDHKKSVSLLSAISLMLLISMGLTGLTACESSNLTGSAASTGNSSQASADAGRDSPESSGTTAADTAASATLAYDDQTKVEDLIKAFGKAIENGDYDAAEEYCTPDFKDYMVELAGGNGAVTDRFSMAITEKLPIKLVSVKGYYDEGDKGLNYTITKDKPTVHFLAAFEIQTPDGKKEQMEGYTQGVKDIDGQWHIESFASGR